MVERVFLEIIFSLLLKVFTIYFEPVGRGYKSFYAVIYTPTHFYGISWRVFTLCQTFSH